MTRNFLSLAILVILNISSSFGNEQNKTQFTVSHQKRNLQQSYCEIYDTLFLDVCLQCYDQFSLPDCTTCPIGQKNQNGICIKCPEGSLNCEDTTNELFCFLGFSKVGNTCACNPPKRFTYDWCTSEGEVYYLSYYTPGLINSKFSNEIIINSLADTTQYEFNKTNCGVITNISDYPNIQNSMECKIQGDKRNTFLINLQNSKASEEYYKIIPKFDINKLKILLGQQIKIANIMVSQKTSLSVNQEVYFSLTKTSEKLCYPSEKTKFYLLFPGQQTFPSEYITVKGLKEAHSVYFDIYKGFYDPTEQQNLLDGLNSYPNMNFEFVYDHQKYRLKFKCTLPFGIQQTDTITLQQEKLNNVMSMTISIEKTYYSPDHIYVWYKLLYSDNQNYREAQFKQQIRLLDDQTNIEVKKLPFEDCYSGEFGYIYIDMSGLVIKDYNIEISNYYNLIPNNIRVHTELLQYIEPLYKIKILNRESYLSVNPLMPFPISASLESSQPIPDTITVSWELIDQESNPITNLNAIINQPESRILDFNQIYKFECHVADDAINSADYIATDIVYIHTFLANLIVEYDQDYKTFGLQSYLKLAFNYIYQGYDILERNTYTHFFELQQYDELEQIYSTYTYPGNIAPQVYLQLDQYPEIDLTKEFKFRYLVKDSSNNIFAFSERHQFVPNIAPGGCWLNMQPQTGISFVDYINLAARDCYSDEISTFYYQFMYYNSQDEKDLETTDPSLYTRKYLSKYITSHQLNTLLPPGNLIIVIHIKDNNDGRMVLSGEITIDNSAFTEQQYEEFLVSYHTIIVDLKNNQEYEEELCGISIALEAIETFEFDNPTLDPSQSVLDFKQYLKDRLILLPSLIPTKYISLQMQEFIFRCLDRLYSTKKSPDYNSFLNRLNDLQDIIVAKAYEIDYLIDFLVEAKDNYQKQMTIALDMTQKFITEIEKSPYDLIPWNQKKLDCFYNIQKLLSLTMNINQDTYKWEGDFVTITVQRVDSILYINNYLQSLSIPLDRQYNLRYIYDVLLQFWKENIYAKDPSFISQVSPYYSKTTGVIRQELDRIYPAINAYIITNYDRPVYTESKRRRRVLYIEEEEFLVLPADTNLRFEFKDIEGTGKVVCTQRISSVWSKKSCKSVVEKQGDKFKVSCYCSSPSYTTLIYDVESLFVENENVQNIFSEQGIESIFSMDNWYDYAAVYSIFGINLIMVVSLIFGNRLDKVASLGGASVVFTMILGKTKIQPETQPTEQNLQEKENSDEENQNKSINKEIKDENQIQEEAKNKQLAPQKEGSQVEIEKINDIKQNPKVDPILDRRQLSVTPLLLKQGTSNLQTQPTETLNPKNEIKQEDIQQVSEAQQKAPIKKMSSIIPQPQNQQEPSSKRVENKNQSEEKETITDTERLNTQLNTEQVENFDSENKINLKTTNRDLNQPSISLDQEVQNDEKGDNKIVTTQQTQKASSPTENLQKTESITLLKSDSQIQEIKAKKVKRKVSKNLEQQTLFKQQESIKQFMSKVSLLRGIGMFHLLGQIILVYNSKLSRTYRFLLYYSQLIWLLTINATFGDNITVSQVFILSIISSSSFFVFNQILELLQRWMVGRYFSYILFFGFLGFCYYATFVSISSASSSDSNNWMLSYIISLAISVIIIGITSAFVRLYITKYLINRLLPNNFLFILTTADIIFEIFQ